VKPAFLALMITDMAEAPWNVIIVGQGLAGTTLAWHLPEAGKRKPQLKLPSGLRIIQPFD